MDIPRVTTIRCDLLQTQVLPGHIEVVVENSTPDRINAVGLFILGNLQNITQVESPGRLILNSTIQGEIPEELAQRVSHLLNQKQPPQILSLRALP